MIFQRQHAALLGLLASGVQGVITRAPATDPCAVRIASVFASDGAPLRVEERCASAREAMTFRSSTDDYQPVLAVGEAARATVEDNIATTGWMNVMVTTSAQYADFVQAEAAGLAEGKLTALRSLQQWSNTFGNDYAKADPAMWDRIRTWKATAELYARERFDRAASTEDKAYWSAVMLVSDQLRGLTAGLAQGARAIGREPLGEFEVWMMTADGDLGDLTVFLATGFNATRSATGSAAADTPRTSKFSKTGSCSGLVRWTGSELFIAHDTWSEFASMLRAWKVYDFAFAGAGSRVAMSSYPGTIVSGDDFLQISSSGLVAIETTNDVVDTSVYTANTPESVFEYIRAMVASRLARTGAQWAEIFSRENNGCYNNDWIVVDYNLFSPGLTTLTADTVTVLSQMPGLIKIHDRTDWVNTDGYFGSYNVPSDEEVWKRSGYEIEVAKYGDWFTYRGTPRAPLFKRLAPSVTGSGPEALDAMRRVMMHNEFQTDPEAECDCLPLGASGENAIAARSDLNPINGTYPFPALGYRGHGAIDAKIASFNLLRNNRTEIISGPTYLSQPPFDWTTTTISAPHEGQPDRWEFPWVKAVA
jgi:hypothetical protein